MELGSISDRPASSCCVRPGSAEIKVMTPKWGGRSPSGSRARANSCAVRRPFQDSRNPGALASGSGGGRSNRMWERGGRLLLGGARVKGDVDRFGVSPLTHLLIILRRADDL